MAVVVAALVVFGVLAFVGSRAAPRPTSNTGGDHASTTGRTAATTTPSAPRRSRTKHRTKTTPTTAPNQLVAQSSTADTATYSVACGGLPADHRHIRAAAG